jgi:CBS domain-containing protein
MASYHLVVIMLSILAGLAVVIISLPLFVIILNFKDAQAATGYSTALIDFSKWALAVLLGAFGAWIGAGAAYFFGKENLRESSRSTAEALRIQQEGFRGPQIERIKDMTLTAMNPNFIFGPETTRDVVESKLREFRGYWFVPVVDDKTGALKDVMHIQVFWSPALNADKQLKDMITHMNTTPEMEKLHGDQFYVKVSPDDKIIDVYNLMSHKQAEVAVVVDEKGKATNCLTKSDLSSYLRTTEGRRLGPDSLNA